MEEHKCLHEVDFATMRQDIHYLTRMISDLHTKFSNGIPTKLAVHDEQLLRLQKVQWTILFVLVFGVVGAIVKSII